MAKIFAVISFLVLVVLPFYLSHRSRTLVARINKERERRQADGLGGKSRSGV